MTREELIIWRRQRGHTQGQLGDLIGYSRQAVIHWERGRHPIPDDLELKLMRAQPAEAAQRQRREGRITPAGFPQLYTFERDIMKHRPNERHPNALARKGLLGWSGMAWFYANVLGCSKPRADILDTDAYAQALEDLAARRVHPGVEAVRRWFTDKTVMPGVRIDPGTPWPKLYLNDAAQPWEGFNSTWERPELAESSWAIVRAPLPAGYYWSRTHQMVFLEEADGT